MAYTSLGNGFEITGANYIDKRIVLTKAEMLTAEDDYFLPDLYFAYCPDDNLWYFYSVDNEEDPETGKYKPMPAGLVNDVLVNGVSVVEDKIAHVDTIEDVKVDGSSVVEDHIANIDLSDKQDKLTAGDKIKIENNVISVEGLKDYEPGYGILIDSEGNVSIDTEVVPEKNTIPEKVSDLENDLGFITKAVANLENYYLKAETYTQEEINNLLASLGSGLKLEVVAVLPVTGDDKTIYLVRRTIDSNIYDQWVYQPENPTPWIQVGSTEVNLDNYYTKDEIDTFLWNKQNKLIPGAGIALNNNFIAVDMGNTLTTTGNQLDVKQATPYQKGVVAYDDNTIKMNANGQLYSVGGGGGGGSYVAGPNIQISGNVISATDTKYTAGDAIEIGNDNKIHVLYDDDLIKLNRRGQLTMDAVGLDTGEGIEITDQGVIKIKPDQVARAIDLGSYQKAFTIGEGLYWTENDTKLNAIGGGGSEGGETTFSSIKGYPNENANLAAALNAKENQLVAGTSNVTLNRTGGQTIISVSGGGSGGASTFGELGGSPYDNIPLKNALDSKQDALGPTNKLPASNIDGLAPVATSGDYNDLTNKPTISNETITINQGGTYKGSFTLNQENGAVINLDAGGGSTPGNGTLTIQRNGSKVQSFTANQTSNATANIKVPTFSYNTSTGVLTITDN